jgi:hypothetical protein
MASEQGVVEHYERVCECAWQQPCATANPGFTPYLSFLGTPCLKKKNSGNVFEIGCCTL